MTSERDLVRTQLHQLTTKTVAEKASLMQRLEETEDGAHGAMAASEQRYADFSRRISLLEAERRELVSRNCPSLVVSCR